VISARTVRTMGVNCFIVGRFDFGPGAGREGRVERKGMGKVVCELGNKDCGGRWFATTHNGLDR